MGPHGLVIGATGSGKSELLRTLVLGLAVTHSPEQLNIVLVDFKGGATFAGHGQLPHVSAVITNLAQELTLVDRMQDALAGEMVRRQELLREAGNYASIRDYEKARAAGEPLAPMPSLFIVVDEFSEMLSAKPEFIDLFVAIGRLGRSLGLHLLLASQRLEEGRLRGLESHLSYRIGLRTFSAQESRSVLGVPDAYELPPVPGLGYLKPDPTTLLKFKAAYVSGPPATARPRVRRDEGGHVQGICRSRSPRCRPSSRVDPEPEVGGRPAAPQGEERGPARRGRRAHGRAGPAGPPGVAAAARRARHPRRADARPRRGPRARPGARRTGAAQGGLVVPLGAVDRPREQRRDTLTINLAGSGGHVAVVGGPRSGKSTLLRTIVTSMSLTTTPLESQFFVLDFGGGTFAPLARLPHVAGVGSRSEPDVVRRIVAEVTGVVDRREAYFRRAGHRLDRDLPVPPAAGRADDGYGDVFLVVDGWSTLRADFDDLELELQQLAARGLTFGLHIVARRAGGPTTAPRCATCSAPGSSCASVTRSTPRSTARSPRWCRPAGPVAAWCPASCTSSRRSRAVDGEPDPATVGDGIDDLVKRSDAAWRGRAAPSCACCPS